MRSTTIEGDSAHGGAIRQVETSGLPRRNAVSESKAPVGIGSGYVPILDGLRALSIALVLLSHLVMFRSDVRPLRSFAHASGGIGVSIFFVVSGYLITSLLLREELRRGRIDLKTFYIRRALRILPASYAYLACLLVLVLTGMLANTSFSDLLAALLYVRNYVGGRYETMHLWSLSLEEQFYLVWPAALVLTPKRHRGAMVAIAIGSVVAWRAVMILTGHAARAALEVRTDLRVDTVLLGCALALLASSRFRHALRVPAVAHPALFLPLFAGLLVWGYATVDFPFHGFIESIGAAAFIVLIVNWCLRNQATAIGRLLESAPARVVGRLSYSLYLWQQLILGPVHSPLRTIRLFPLNILFLVGATLGSYWLVERPFLRLKDRLATR